MLSDLRNLSDALLNLSDMLILGNKQILVRNILPYLGKVRKEGIEISENHFHSSDKFEEFFSRHGNQFIPLANSDKNLVQIF